ncbi:hypothetical protein LTR53_003371 [Teratosphaeriaceae sp. CCFEE 6253]|nr:hypothetical protein LTR53_003371 [Teratosphaeriaceae sp. CCFEE 6253]
MPPHLTFIPVSGQGKSSESHRAVIRSHVMRGKNKRVDSRRSAREAARAAAAPIAVPTAAELEHFAKQANVSKQADVTKEVERWDRDCSDGDDGQPEAGAVAALGQMRRHLRVRTGVASAVDGREMGPGELIAGFLVYDRLKSAAFPMEQVVKLDILENSYIPWLFRDQAFAHSILLATSAFNDYRLSQPLSRTTLFHLKRTLGHLNKQLSDESAYQSDTVIYTVVTLAVLASMFGDPSATGTHMAGLQRIVQLRGGESFLSVCSKQHFMLERLDLAWSLSSGCSPHFSHRPTDWQSAFPSPQTASQMDGPVIMIDDLVDSRLATVFYDLRRLAKIINTHGGQGRRMRGDVFQRVLVSIQRRLLWLRYTSKDDWSECLRLGMLAQLTATFQLAGRKIDYGALSAQFQESLEVLKASGTELQTLSSWLLLVAAMSVFDSEERWLRAMWKRFAVRESSWEEERKRLGSVIWMNGVHDEPGKRAFAALNS